LRCEQSDCESEDKFYAFGQSTADFSQDKRTNEDSEVELNSLSRFVKRISMLFGRGRFGSELDEEMTFHREQAEKDFISAGMAPEAAKYAAMRQFGNATRLKERSHEVVGFKVETVGQDLKFAVRQLRKNPGFAATAIVILALGIGASVAIFAFVDAALIKPLPYPNPTRLMAVNESSAGFARNNLSYPDYVDWKRMNRVFSSMEVFVGTSYGFSTPTGTEPVPGERVSAGFFKTLGIQPMLGRDFHAGEDVAGAAPVVLLSYGTWQRRYGGRSDVVGESVDLSGVAYTIVGVLPKEFQFAPRDNAEFWEPLQPTHECEKRRSCHNLDGVGRLRDGVTIQNALAEMVAIAAQLEKQYPDSNRGNSASVITLSEAIVGDVRPIFLVLLAGAGLLLFIACVNVSSLLLVRAESRRREIAVRGALGASRARLSRQFVTEGLALVAAGTGLGLTLASGGMKVLIGLLSKDIMIRVPFLRGLGLNAHVLGFAVLLAVLAGILFSLTPIFHLRLSNMRDGLTAAGRGSAGTLWRRMGANLVVVELATAVVLLTGAGLLGKSLYKLLHVELGFQSDHLATINIGLPEAAYSKDAQVVEFAGSLVGRVESLPGVESAAITSVLPVACNCNTDWVRFVGRPYNGIHNEVNERDESAGFFNTIHARLLRGRYFTDAEDGTKPMVAVINEAFAKKYFPGEDPIGKRMGDTELKPKSIREIIGVVVDFKDAGLDQEQWPAEYLPFNQSTDTYFSMIVRTRQDERTILPLLAATIHKVGLDAAVEEGSTMTQQINDSPTAYIHRLAAYLVGGFAVLALVLGVVGLYGVIAYSVSQRTREIGVRMALGAQRSSVYKLVLGEAGRLIGVGVVVGLAGSVGAAMLMGKLLFGVQAWDAGTLVSVAVVLGAAAMMASYFPARRAASVNPTEALRAE
jgi:macrolide transport system ATP-binding/permease protein